MFKFSFNPDPLFYSVGFNTRTVKATEKELLAMYNAGAHGLKKPEEIAIAIGMDVSEYRQICESDPRAAVAAAAGVIHGKLKYTQKMMTSADEGDVKAIAFLLTHIYDMMPTKPLNDNDNTVTVVVKNAEPEPM